MSQPLLLATTSFKFLESVRCLQKRNKFGRLKTKAIGVDLRVTRSTTNNNEGDSCCVVFISFVPGHSMQIKVSRLLCPIAATIGLCWLVTAPQLLQDFVSGVATQRRLVTSFACNLNMRHRNQINNRLHWEFKVRFDKLLWRSGD